MQGFTLLVSRLLFGIACLTMLSSCALLQPQGGTDAIQAQLNKLNHWQVRGKMSVSTPNDSVTGYMDWAQNIEQYDLYIAGPLGQGATRLKGKKGLAELTLPGWKEPQQAASAEMLMQEHLGWNFPVSDIRYWVKGQASPNSPFTAKYNEAGLLEELSQYGWTISYKRYSQNTSYWLPGLVKVKGYGFRFVFSIKEWTIYD